MSRRQFGLMVERCMAPASIPILLDLGYVNQRATRDRGDALMAFGIGRKNFSIEGFNRLLVKVSPKKFDAVLKKFPIVAGGTYFQTTHHWRGLKKGERTAHMTLPANSESDQ